MFKRIPIPFAVVCVALVAGCQTMDGWQSGPQAPDDHGLCSAFGCDNPAGNGQTISTQNGNVGLLFGYNVLFDKTTGLCVEPDDSYTGTGLSVDSTSETFEMVYVTSRNDLARELGVDLGLKVKYMAVANVDAGFNLLSKFKRSSTAVSFLMKMSQDYMVRNRRPVLLSEDAKQLLGRGGPTLVNTCGVSYVNGIRFGGQLYALITFQAEDEQTSMDIKANLGVGVNGGAYSVDGDLQTRFLETANRSDVLVKLQVVAQGFNLSGSAANSSLVKDFLGSGLTEDTFSKIDELRTHMQTSIELDACRDAGQGQCDGEESPGYFNNSRRGVKVTGVDIGFYDTLPNVDRSKENPYVVIRDELSRIERFIRDYSELQERMEMAYNNEIEPFLHAPDALKASHNVAPPGEALRSPLELMEVANHWMDRFYPEIGPQIGWAMQEATDRIDTCWSNSSVDIFYQCAPDGKAATDMEEWQAVLTELEDYAATGRILPLRVKQLGAFNGQQAHNACYTAGFGSGETAITYRLPTRAEVARLGPLVGFGSVHWQGTEPHEIWYIDPDSERHCPKDNFPHPLYVNRPADEDDAWWCAQSGRLANVICVASTGPSPLLEAP